MTEPLDRLATALADRYRIERELGAGGMATVYLAHDVRHDRKVAVKVLKPELAAVIGADRFVVEIKTTAALQHPHILPLFDSGQADGFLYYVMPYIEGETLRGKLDRETQLGIDESVKLTTAIADALDYAHRHGVIHRDIKPENILIHDGRPMVADFGIALALSAAAGGRMTETGMSLGTPHYMSPEQATADKEITGRSDIYSLGSVLYEMLAGEPPHIGHSAQQIIMKIIAEEVQPVTKHRKAVPPNVAAAVAKSLEKLPADRFGTAKEFADALTDRGFSTVATHASSLPAYAPTRLRAALPWALAGLALVAALWGWSTRSRAPGTSRQYVRVGDGTALGDNIVALTLSPDGNTLVVRDNSQNGRFWLKRRGELTPVAIPGTERSNFPAFSPDGQWLAFIADGHVKKIHPDGGAAITLADSAQQQYGGTVWLSDGTILFVGPQFSALSRVKASGGPTTFALNDTALSGYAFGGLGALPDSRGVLFSVCNSGCVTMSLNVLDLRTGEHHLLLNDVVQGWYLPGGRLLYVRRDGAALVAPFDLGTLEITGAAVPVLEKVVAGAGTAALAVSPSGTLVYLEGSGVLDDVELVRLDRKGGVSPLDSAWHGQFNSFALSADGRRLAVGVGNAAGALSIWTRSLGRGPFTRLTFGGNDRRPAWSPDGSAVAYIHDSLGGSVVFVRKVDGSSPAHLLARLDRQIQEVVWSPRGDWLILRTDNGAAGAGDILGIRTTGDSTPVSLVAGPYTEIQPAVSPDGRWLAYMSDESGINEVYVRPFPGTSAGRWQVSSGGGFAPRWAPNGHELDFFDLRTKLMAATFRTSAGFEVTDLRPIVDLGITPYALDGFHASWAILPGDQGFLLQRVRRSAAAQSIPPVVYVENWFADVAQRMRP